METCPVTAPSGTPRKAYLQNCGFSVHFKSRGASEQSEALTFLISKETSQGSLGKCSLDSVALKPLVQTCLLSLGGFGPDCDLQGFAVQINLASIDHSCFLRAAFTLRYLTFCTVWKGKCWGGYAAKCYGETRHHNSCWRKEALFSSPAVAAARWQPPLFLKRILAAICSDPPQLKFELGSW